MEKRCEYCNKIFNDSIKISKYSSGRFCSLKCSRGYSTREKRQEINSKVSNTISNLFKNNDNYILNYLKGHGLEHTKDKINAIKDRKKILKDALEKYTHCVECGKEIKNKFGSGKFCSRSCASKTGGRARNKKDPIGGHTSKLQIMYTTKSGEQVKLHSNYEVLVAKSLDANNIKWVRPKPFIWKDSNNQEYRYYPDFYLIDYDTFLDPKNDYLIIKDKEKISLVEKQNNIRVIILDKNELNWNEIKKII